MNLRNLVVLMFLLLTPGALVNAQDRGTITGQVVDTSGAVVPDAKVTLTNPATGQNITVETNAEGAYTFLSLTAGRYEVVAEKEGFRKAQAANVVVQVSTTTRLDIKMELGAVQETVQVESTTPLLQTDRSDLGTVVDNKAIQQLPLFINGGLRSNLAFTSLAPGVTMNLQSDPDTTGGAPRIAGGQANGASLLVDGGESMSERRNDPQMRVVSAEAVEEFKVQTSAYSAEFGRSSNGVLNYTTKSGTNALHGSFMAQLRHEKLNAKGFFWGAARRVGSAPARRSRQHRRPGLHPEGLRRPQQDLLLLRRRAFARQELQQHRPDLAADRGFPQRRLPPLHQRRRPDGAVVRSARRQRQHDRQRRQPPAACSATAF